MTSALMVLMYFSAHLSDSQQKWHPYQEPFYAFVCTNREAVKPLGLIPKIFYTDHASTARQVVRPLDRTGPL